MPSSGAAAARGLVVVSADGGAAAVGRLVGAADGVGRAATRAGTAAGRRPVTRAYAASPGHAVRDMSRWPAMVAAVTSVPAGHRLDPRETNVVVAPAAGRRRSARRARRAA